MTKIKRTLLLAAFPLVLFSQTPSGIDLKAPRLRVVQEERTVNIEPALAAGDELGLLETGPKGFVTQGYLRIYRDGKTVDIFFPYSTFVKIGEGHKPKDGAGFIRYQTPLRGQKEFITMIEFIETQPQQVDVIWSQTRRNLTSEGEWVFDWCRAIRIVCRYP